MELRGPLEPVSLSTRIPTPAPGGFLTHSVYPQYGDRLLADERQLSVV